MFLFCFSVPFRRRWIESYLENVPKNPEKNRTQGQPIVTRVSLKMSIVSYVTVKSEAK
jgi:hypothetical protein